MNIGLFYGSSTCYTEMAAEKIRDIIGPELVTLHNLKDDAVALMEQYDVLILGIPTWDFGEIQEDWEAIWDQLDSVNFEGKIIAMYGMGDQLGYGEWFLDALGMLHDKLAPKGATFIESDDPDLFNWLMNHGKPADTELQRMVQLIQTRNQERGPVAI